MENLTLIKEILKNYGSFSIYELDKKQESIFVSQLGQYVGLAEYFALDFCGISIYDSDGFNSNYQLKYEDLSENTLNEILNLCQQWEKESI